MKTLKGMTLLAFIGCMLITAVSYAQRPSREEWQQRENNFYNNIPKLTEQQKQQIQKLRTEQAKEMTKQREEMRATTNESERNELRQNMMKKRNAQRDAIRNLLTDEQKKYFDENYPTRQGRPGGENRGEGQNRPGNRPGGQGGPGGRN